MQMPPFFDFLNVNLYMGLHPALIHDLNPCGCRA